MKSDSADIRDKCLRIRQIWLTRSANLAVHLHSEGEYRCVGMSRNEFCYSIIYILRDGIRRVLRDEISHTDCT